LKHYKLNILLSMFVMSLFVGCVEQITQTEEEVTGSGQLRFIHCASSTGELDLTYLDLSDNNFYLAEENVVYGYQYGYYDLKTGDRVFRLYQPSNNIGVSEGKVTVENGKKYTLLAIDLEATLSDEMVALEDTLAVPDSGRTFIRFMHFGADVADLRITNRETGAEVAKLSWLDVSPYVNLNAGTYRFSITDPNGQDTFLEVSPVTFLSGNTYSFILSGTLTDLTPVEFNVKVFTETSL
jgi:hypothetical protein